MTRSGCYKIVNHASGKLYIGSAVNLKRRLSRHLTDLRHGRHDNQHLQRAFDKDGEDAFTFEVIAYCEPGSLLDWEQAFIDACEPEYNICLTAGSCYGKKHTPETKAKIAAAAVGHTLSEESRAKIRAGHLGMKMPPFSEEHRTKMSTALIGNTRWLGKKHTPETRALMSLRATEREARKREGLGG